MSQSKPLTYPSSKFVLEHMHEITRLHIAICCPTLRTIHATTPLRIKYLKLTDSGFYLNNCEHIFEAGCYFIKVGESVFDVCKFPSGMDLDDILKKYFELLLPGNPMVMNYLAFDQIDEIENLPEGLTFRVKQLQIPSNALETVLPFLDPSSFPLKKLCIIKITNCEDSIFESQACQTAQCLNIEHCLYFQPCLVRFIGLPHKTVQVPVGEFVDRTLALLVRDWLEKPRDIRTRFSFAANNDETSRGLFKTIANVTGIQAVKKYTDKYTCLSIPMNDNKELNFYSYRSTEYDRKPAYFRKSLPHTTKVSREQIVEKTNEIASKRRKIPREQLGNFRYRPWVLVMEVMAAGTAMEYRID